MEKRSVFNFNHIDPDHQEETLNELKNLYRFYHKLWFCYKKLHASYKRDLLVTNLISAFLVAGGTIAGGITLNPIVLGVISGAELLLKTIAEFKNYKSKIEKCKFAFTTYEKTLSEIRCFLRGETYDPESFIQKMKLLDKIIIDLSLNYEKYSENDSQAFKNE